MRHVSRTHGVALDWFCERINWEVKIQIKYVDTKNQLADILTKGSFSKNEWNHLVCLFNRMSFSLYYSFLSQVKERIVIDAMSKRGQNTTSNDGSPTAKARPVNLVMRSQYKEETSSSSLGSRVSPGNDDERKRVGQALGNWMLGDSKSEVENSQVSRQEKILQTTRKLWQKVKTQIKSEEDPPGTRKLAAHSPEFRNMDCTNHRCMEKIFQHLEQKLGMSAINATFSMDSYKTNVLTWGLFVASSMKEAIHVGPGFLTNSKIYKNTKFENIWSEFNITQKLVIEHSEEIMNVKCLEYSSPSWTRSILANESKCQVGRRQKYVSTLIPFFVSDR